MTRRIKFMLFCVCALIPILAPAQQNSKNSFLGNRVIVAKGDRQFASFEFIDHKGQPNGFSVELFRALIKKLDIKYTLQSASILNWTRVPNSGSDCLSLKQKK